MLNNKFNNLRNHKEQQTAGLKSGFGLIGLLVACLPIKQTQEDLTQRTLFYTSDGRYLPDPNELNRFRNRGIFWNQQTLYKGRNNAV